MTLFIVGGAGYIGSHMVKLAHLAGHKVITLDNLSTGHRDAVLYGAFEYCDIQDANRLNELFKKYTPDAVMHFSAYSLVGESMSDPYKYYNNNTVGTLNLLKAMIDNDCKNFIFSSTAAVFGNPEYIPIDEKHPKNPINPYGKSKLMIEQMLEDFDSAYGLKYVVFRYFNAAGHDESGELTERHDPETHLLPLIMQTVRGEREAISIYGNDYDTKDGTCVRDYIHVNDLSRVHLQGVEYLMSGDVDSKVYNLGNGEGFSVKEIIEKVKEITGKDFKVIEDERRAGDPDTLIASSQRAKDELGFKPEVDRVEDIIKTLV
ncbi:MAG TPA: UDP-glucose 4-epimerase GalE [Campylobacterales bacterium]|nr:UDP-glucose 4-epimerase GalE [Campylobacterales bacterium]